MSNELHPTLPGTLPRIEYTRDFDHDDSVVFHAHVDAQLLAQWLGPHCSGGNSSGFSGCC